MKTKTNYLNLASEEPRVLQMGLVYRNSVLINHPDVGTVRIEWSIDCRPSTLSVARIRVHGIGYTESGNPCAVMKLNAHALVTREWHFAPCASAGRNKDDVLQLAKLIQILVEVSEEIDAAGWAHPDFPACAHRFGEPVGGDEWNAK